MFKNKLSTYGTLCAVTLLASACSTASLGKIPQTREGYNQALNKSDNEQFLLNIVKLHYDKSPFFVGIDSVTTRTTLKYSTGGDDTKIGNATNGTKGAGGGPLGAFWNLQPNIEFTTSPTITYSPLQGTTYISGLLTPIDITKLYYLIQTNLNLATTLKLTIDQLGYLDNRNDFIIRQNNKQQNQDYFGSFADKLDVLRGQNKLGIYLSNYQPPLVNNPLSGQLESQIKINQPSLAIVSYDDATAQYIANALKLDKPYKTVIISRFANNDVKGNVVKLKTRSFFSTLNGLSTGVATPADLLKQNYTQVVSESQVSLQNPIFKMSYSTDTPTAINKVQYNGYWYYINNNDITSKTTLILIKLMYALQAGEVTDSTWSLLNLPVADQ